MVMRSFWLNVCVLTAILIMILSCDTESNLERPDKNFFIKYYGGDGNQKGVDFEILSDGILLVGNSQLGQIKNVLLIKVDFEGTVLWQKYVGGPSDVAVDLEPALDGTFVLLSRHEISEADHDLKLIRFNSEGHKMDSVLYGTTKKETPHSVTALSDEGFIVSGGTQYDTLDFDPANPDEYSNIFFYRFDSQLQNQETNWYPYYGGRDQYEVATRVFQNNNGNFFCFGYSDFKHAQNPDGKLAMLYMALGQSGGLNSIAFSGEFTQNTQSTFVMKIPAGQGGGYLHLGTRFNTSGRQTIQATKLREPLTFNNLSDAQFDEEFSASNRSLSAISAAVCQTGQSGFLILGDETRSLGTKNIFLQKLTLQGDPIWSISLGSEDGNDEGARVGELPDGKLVVLGTVELANNQSKIALFKLNSEGRLQ
jgi:hypothetical protein